LPTNEDGAIATVQELVKAANDVYVNPRRGRFDPHSARSAYNPDARTSDDSALIVAGARGFYEGLGMRVAHEETVEHEQVKTAMLPVGESRIELLEATAEDSVIGRFVAKRGEGLHHIAVAVESVDATFERLKEQGVRLASDAVRVGAGGHRYFFVHPASTGGVLLEIVGDAASSAAPSTGSSRVREGGD